MTSQFIEGNSKRNVRDTDVEEVYLSNSGIETLPDFSKYKNLKTVYLNNNKLFYLTSGLNVNYILTELYLQHNKLVNINGYIQHLTCLKILLLHGNQLTSLTDVIHELRHMMDLKVLNLMNNPLAQEYSYRDYTVHHIKTLELLDRRAVNKSERDKIFKKYEVHQQNVRDNIAFGRHVNGTLSIAGGPQRIENKVETHYEAASVNNDTLPVERTESDISQRENADEIIVRKNVKLDQKYASAIETREKTRSTMQFKTFDWLNILQSREKRCDEKCKDVVIYSAKLR